MVTPDSERYRRLPEPVHLEDTVASQPTEDAPDPENGRNTTLESMLRYAGF